VPGPAAARRNESRKIIKKSPAGSMGKSEVKSFYRNNRYFFCSMGKALCKSEFKDFSIFFPERGEKRSQVGIQRNFNLFFRSMEKNEVKSEFKENLKNMQIFSGASAADPRIKLCPRLAGLGPRRDYSIRPASACRWARPVRRDTGECARNKPACEAGRLC